MHYNPTTDSIEISVRELCALAFKGGNLDNRVPPASLYRRAEEGREVHEKLRALRESVQIWVTPTRSDTPRRISSPPAMDARVFRSRGVCKVIFMAACLSLSELFGVFQIWVCRAAPEMQNGKIRAALGAKCKIRERETVR